MLNSSPLHLLCLAQVPFQLQLCLFVFHVFLLLFVGQSE